MLKTIIHILTVAALVTALTDCSGDRPPELNPIDQMPSIFPNYIDVTIPAEIAPMNFNIINHPDMAKAYVRVSGEKGGLIESDKEWADFDIDDWHRLTEQNRGADLIFDVYVKDNANGWMRYKPFRMHVSEYPLNDYGVTYRKIAPGFETFSKIGIYQRCLSTFEESPILEETAVKGQCLNCHYSNRGNPEQYSIHIRGANGGTLINTADGLKCLETKTDQTPGSCTYGYWHPDGRYCAYSLNRIYQNFYVGEDRFTEPWDMVSDIVVLDTETCQLITTPMLMTDAYETTPAFSADGNTVYFCYSPSKNMPAEYESLKYSLCSIPFDSNTGRFGNEIDTLIDALVTDKSVSMPRPSYDGRYLMYCITDYGTTPVARPESDLWLMDLSNGSTREMTEVNSTDADAYHNWSSDSRWFLFGSRRTDHLYSYLYFSSIDDDGVATKPFLMPQRKPQKYYLEALHSFNAPDFTTSKVMLDVAAASDMVRSGVREHVTLQK